MCEECYPWYFEPECNCACGKGSLYKEDDETHCEECNHEVNRRIPKKRAPKNPAQSKLDVIS
jgi:hypothetical protein